MKDLIFNEFNYLWTLTNIQKVQHVETRSIENRKKV